MINCLWYIVRLILVLRTVQSKHFKLWIHRSDWLFFSKYVYHFTVEIFNSNPNRSVMASGIQYLIETVYHFSRLLSLSLRLKCPLSSSLKHHKSLDRLFSKALKNTHMTKHMDIVIIWKCYLFWDFKLQRTKMQEEFEDTK